MAKSRSFIMTVVLFVIVCVLMALTIIFHWIALGSNSWLKSDSNVKDNFLSIGHFQACFDDYYHPHEKPPTRYDGCHDLYSDEYKNIRDWLIPSWLVSAKVIAIIALIMQLVSAALVVLLILWVFCKWAVCYKNDDWCERIVYYTAPILFILSGMFMMAVVMIWADNAFRLQCKDFWVGNPNHNHLSWGWGFEVAATVLAFISGGFLIWVVALRAREEI